MHFFQIFLVFILVVVVHWYLRFWRENALILWREPKWSYSSRLQNEIHKMVSGTSWIRVSILLFVILPAVFYGLRGFLPDDTNWVNVYLFVLIFLPVGIFVVLMFHFASAILDLPEVKINEKGVFFLGNGNGERLP